MADYYMALAEVNEILNYVENKYIIKIPKDILAIIKENKSENSCFKYDISKPLSKQNIHKETIEILSYLNYNFWLNETEKNNFKKIYNDNLIKIEDEKRNKYNPDSIFKNKSKNFLAQKENLPMPIKEKNNFFINIIKKIKAIIKRSYANK